jgi:hypothetical protein
MLSWDLYRQREPVARARASANANNNLVAPAGLSLEPSHPPLTEIHHFTQQHGQHPSHQRGGQCRACAGSHHTRNSQGGRVAAGVGRSRGHCLDHHAPTPLQADGQSPQVPGGTQAHCAKAQCGEGHGGPSNHHHHQEEARRIACQRRARVRKG